MTVYMSLALKVCSPIKPGGTWYRILFIKRTLSLMNFTSCVSCDFGKQRNKLHSALERKPCTNLAEIIGPSDKFVPP